MMFELICIVYLISLQKFISHVSVKCAPAFIKTERHIEQSLAVSTQLNTEAKTDHADYSTLLAENQKLMEDYSEKKNLFVKQIDELRLMNSQIQAEGEENKQKDANKISDLVRENKQLLAQIKQLKSTTTQNNSYKDSDDNQYEVEAIVNHKKTTQYLIRWKGFDKSNDTWENESNLDCSKILKKYKRLNGLQ